MPLSTFRPILALTLATLTALTGCALSSKEQPVTLTASEVATIAETTAHNAAQEASLVHKLHRELSPDTDDVECWDDIRKEKNGLYKIERTYTFENLDNASMIASGRIVRDHLTKNGWTITQDKTTSEPSLHVGGMNHQNGLYATLVAGNHGILLILNSGCLKRGNLVITTPSTSYSPTSTSTSTSLTATPTRTIAPIPTITSQR